MDKVGPAFGELISTEKIKRRKYDESGPSYEVRSYLIPVILIISLSLLVLRLFFIQFIQGSYYRNLSDSNRIKTIVIHAPRGTIFDRNGKPLVYNVPGFREIVNGKTKLISQDEAISFLAQGKKDLEIDSLRQYPYKDAMTHVVGYLGQVSENELKTPKYQGYSTGEVVGKMGVEKQYESFLKGTDGRQLAEVDSSGKIVRKLGQTDPISGRNITLTLDADLQKTAYDSMKNVPRGAVD